LCFLLSVLQYDDHILQLFVSSLFLAGAFAALVGMWTCKVFGRRFTMIMGGLAFIIGESSAGPSAARWAETFQLVCGCLLMGQD
jgi:putative Ca2+/H+ antiporter (TMEM165/GDT1 family)